MRPKLYIIPLLLFSLTCSAQKFTISGYVSDSKSGEKLIGANIVDQRSKKGTITNTYGFYSLTLPSDSIQLVISFVGYNAQSFAAMLNMDTSHNFLLKPMLELETVEIVADQKIEEKVRMSTIDVPIEQIKKIPPLLGEVDVIKALQLLPGVKSGGEGSTGLYVRGGGPDQNLILLDGAPVYNASHLFGFFSVFNADAIKNVELTKGGFPARYGGRLSSVVDITMKEGNAKRYNIEGSIGLISSKLLLEGPIWKNKSSFIISARRTYVDLITRPIIRLSTGGNSTGGYYFYDFNAKINHTVSDKDHLFLSFYGGNDVFFAKIGNKIDDGYVVNNATKWGNILGALRWNHLFNNKMFGNAAFTYTQYQFGISNQSEDYTGEPPIINKQEYLTGIYDWSGKYNLNYIPGPDHNIKTGIQYTYHTFNTGATTYKLQNPDDFSSFDSTLGYKPIYANDLNLYAEDEWKINEKLTVNAGLHAALFHVNKKLYKSLQPRVSSRYLFKGSWSVKASYANMMQFVHLLTNSNVGLPTDLWVPVTDKIKPQTSDQVALGLAKSFFKNKYEISVESYYKQMNNIIDYLDGATFYNSSNNWESKVAAGKGFSYGSEFLLQKKIGKVNGWIGYTLAWTNRQIDKINNGEIYPYKYDRRHDISIVFIYKFTKKLDFSFTWVYGTGNAISLPLQTYLAPNVSIGTTGSESNNNYEITYYGAKNNYRMPSYHRLDVGLNFHQRKKWGRSSLSLNVYNAYNRQNPFYLYFQELRNGSKALYQRSLFPIIPTLTYTFKIDANKLIKVLNEEEENDDFE